MGRRVIYVEDSLAQKVEKERQKREQEVYVSSQVISDTMRYLTISGIAVAWMFRNESSNILFIISIFIFVLNLLLDMFYNHYRMMIYLDYSRDKLKKSNPPENPEKVEEIINEIPESTERASRFFWYLRLILLAIGYFFILMPHLCKLC